MARRSCRRLGVGLGLGVCIFTVGAWSANFPDTDTFQRYSRGKATLIGDYIYIDGGEISQSTLDYRTSDPMNSTLSIDCTSSWTPDSVEIREFIKPESLPIVSNQNLFTDVSRNCFYIWGGYVPFDESADTSNLWRFNVDGEGGGEWVREAPGNVDFYLQLDRTENGVVASSNDAGFIFGGKVLDENSKGTGINAKGSVTFDFESKEWSQSDEGPFSPDASLWGASATFVDGFASEGLIFITGGMNRRDERAAGYLDFGTVHFYDPAEEEWYEQETTGDVPGRRFHHCTVAATDSMNNDTAEIFVYAGWNEDSETAYGDVHILTIPGFHWTKVSEGGTRHQRAEQSCLNMGNSQFVTIGGLRFTGDVDDDWDYADPFPRSIGIFDLNSFEWKEGYDADADAYRRHEDISSWYDDGGLDEVEWTTDGVKALFVSESPDSDQDNQDNQDGQDDGDDGGENNADDSESESDAEDSDSSSSSSTPVGAIAGGVVGGVAAIGLVGGLVWYLRRRKRNANGHESIAELSVPSAIPDHTSPEHEHKSPPPPPSASLSPATVSELGTTNPHENRVELDSTAVSAPDSTAPNASPRWY